MTHPKEIVKYCKVCGMVRMTHFLVAVTTRPPESGHEERQDGLYACDQCGTVKVGTVLSNS